MLTSHIKTQYAIKITEPSRFAREFPALSRVDIEAQRFEFMSLAIYQAGSIYMLPVEIYRVEPV